MKTKSRRTEKKGRRPFREVAGWLAASAGGQLLRFGRAMLRGGGVISMLRIIIVVELCLLGVGVVRRLEESYMIAEKTAKYELALLEEQTFRREQEQRGAVDIVAVGGEDDPTDAPPTRVRDAATIVYEELGDKDAAAEMLMPGNGTAVEPPDEGSEAPANENDDETDVLIRRGVTAMIAGDMRQCIVSLEQAATVAPNHPAMLYYYGLAYDKLLNPRKALDYYNRLFQMRDKAGKYFDRAARRLSYGPEGPAELRGKLAFGPIREQRSYDITEGDRVSILLPVLLAPGESVRANEINVRIDCFEIVNGRKIDFSREKPVASWVNEVQTWENWEEDIEVSYVPPSSDEVSSPDEVRYYGFTAKLFYNGEPMDCVSTPSSLILHEQMLNSRRRGWGASGLLPDDGLDPYAEEAVPYSQGYDEIDTLP